MEFSDAHFDFFGFGGWMWLDDVAAMLPLCFSRLTYHISHSKLAGWWFQTSFP